MKFFLNTVSPNNKLKIIVYILLFLQKLLIMNAKVCPICGHELAAGAKFCFSCGNAVTDAYEKEDVREETPSNNTSHLDDEFKKGNKEERIFVEADNTMLGIQNVKHLGEKTVYTRRNFLERLINIVVKPSQEWHAVNSEVPHVKRILFEYVLLLALLPVIAAFLKYGIIGYKVDGYTYYSWILGLRKALTFILSAIATVYFMAKIFDYLAPSFESEVNFGRSMQLSAYAFTPHLLAAILILFFTSINIFIILIGLCAAFLIYRGLPIIRTPKEMVIRYTSISVIIMEALFFASFSVIEIILKQVFKIFF